MSLPLLSVDVMTQVWTIIILKKIIVISHCRRKIIYTSYPTTDGKNPTKTGTLVKEYSGIFISLFIGFNIRTTAKLKI